jgi:hypothetical protein
MGFTDATKNLVLNEVLGTGSAARPLLGFTDPIFIGASTTTPTEAGGNFTEPVGNNYARVSVVNTATQWPAAVAGLKENGVIINFPIATGSWATITYIGWFSALSGGTPLAFAKLTPAILVNNGVTLSFPIGNVDVRITTAP